MRKTEDFILGKINKKKVEVGNSKNFEVSEVDPLTLISSKRFDIIAKYIYGKFKENNWESDWGTRLYEDHIWVFNNYDEDDESGKKGIKSFINSFNNTLASIKEKGFDENVSVLPIGKNNEPLDGAHRVSAALLYNKKVKVIKLENSEANYDYAFFKKKGLLTKWSDAIAYEYCKLKKDTYIVILLPNEKGQKDKVREILNVHGSVFYEKEIHFKETGIKNLLNELKKLDLQANGGEFNDEGVISVFLFETPNYTDLGKVIEKINTINYSLNYCSYNHSETIHLAQLLFNRNSIHFLNYAKPERYKEFQEAFEQFKYFLVNNNLNAECFCVTSNAVMAAYGLRNSLGIDYFTSRNSLESTNNEHSNNYTKDDIIFNPDNHFYYDGIKFTSLKMVKETKKISGNTNDKKDLLLIKKMLKETEYSSFDKQLFLYKVTKKLKVIKLKLIGIKLRCKKRIKMLRMER